MTELPDICRYDSRHLTRGYPATQLVNIGTATLVPMCDACAERCREVQAKQRDGLGRQETDPRKREAMESTGRHEGERRDV